MSLLMEKLIGWAVNNIFLMLFIFRFLPLRYSRKKSAALCTVSVLFAGALDYVRLSVVEDGKGLSLVIIVIQMIILQGMAFYISESRDSKAVFTNMAASNYLLVGNIAGEITYCLVRQRELSYLCAYGVNIALLLFLSIHVRKPYKKLMEVKIPVFHKLCAIPALFYVTTTLFCFYPVSLYKNPMNIPGAIGLMLTMGVSYVVTFHSVDSINRQHEQSWNLVAMESYAQGMELQYGRIEQVQKDLRIIRHDLRHYTAAVSVLLEEGKYDEIRDILHEISDSVDESNIIRYCENPVINSIMCSMAAQAEKDSIKLQVSMAIPEELPFSSARLGAVLANLLENAMLSVREQELDKRRIKILARCNEKHLIMEIMNPCREVKFDRKTGMPVTSRGEGHGLGLKGVSDFARNHHAVFDCYVKEGIFTARLLVHM